MELTYAISNGLVTTCKTVGWLMAEIHAEWNDGEDYTLRVKPDGNTIEITLEYPNGAEMTLEAITLGPHDPSESL